MPSRTRPSTNDICGSSASPWLLEKHPLGAKFGSNNPHHQQVASERRQALLILSCGTGASGGGRGAGPQGSITISQVPWEGGHRHRIGLCCLALSLDFWSDSCWDQSSRKLILENQIWWFFSLRSADNQTHSPELQIQSVEKLGFKSLHPDPVAVKPQHRAQPSRTVFLSSTTWSVSSLHERMCAAMLVVSHGTTQLLAHIIPVSAAPTLKLKLSWLLLVLRWEQVLLHDKIRRK